MSHSMKEFVTVPFRPDELRCLACSAGLDWQQPDIQNPDRLLGVCPGCGGWHLLHIHADQARATFLLLCNGQDPGPVDLAPDRQPTAPTSKPRRDGPVLDQVSPVTFADPLPG